MLDLPGVARRDYELTIALTLLAWRVERRRAYRVLLGARGAFSADDAFWNVALYDTPEEAQFWTELTASRRAAAAATRPPLADVDLGEAEAAAAQMERFAAAAMDPAGG